MSKLLLVVVAVLPSVIYAQDVVTVPADTAVVRLEADSDITNSRQTLRATKGTYLVSEAAVNNYLLYQTMLLRARDQLLSSKARVDTLLEAIGKMELKLAEMESVSSREIPAELEKLAGLQLSLEQAKMSLKDSNDELASIKSELEKTHKKLQKRGKDEKFIRAVIGTTTLTAGVIIGLLLAGGGGGN